MSFEMNHCRLELQHIEDYLFRCLFMNIGFVQFLICHNAFIMFLLLWNIYFVLLIWCCQSFPNWEERSITKKMEVIIRIFWFKISCSYKWFRQIAAKVIRKARNWNCSLFPCICLKNSYIKIHRALLPILV